MRTARTRGMQTLRSSLMILLSVALLFGAFRLTDAGSLTPSSAPSSTMQSLQEIYDALVGTYDSTAVVADDDGNALEISKCIIDTVNGGPGCP